jgi:hypothetical protein
MSENQCLTKAENATTMGQVYYYAKGQEVER